jgi:hypothetical protein
MFQNVGNRIKKSYIETTENGFKKHEEDLAHFFDQISADLERCIIKQDVKVEPELIDYRLRIAKDLGPLKKQIEDLSLELPPEKDILAKGKTQGKRMTAAKELTSDGNVTKKLKT